MKRFSFVILFLIFCLLFLYNHFLKSSYRAVYITDNCQIAVDTNHNDKISEDEIFELAHITNFCTDENIRKNEKYTGVLTEQEKLYFKILSKKYYEKIFLNSLIRFNNNRILVNFSDAEDLILKKGLALPLNSNGTKYLDTVNKIKNDAKNKEITIIHHFRLIKNTILANNSAIFILGI